MGHAWCKDVARDERVRADEDGRAGPLPTLEGCIAGMFPTVVPEKKGKRSRQKQRRATRTERVTLQVTVREEFFDQMPAESLSSVACRLVARELDGFCTKVEVVPKAFGKWMSVRECKPPAEEAVLAFDPAYPIPQTAFWDGLCWTCDDARFQEPSHWMPLPEDPEGFFYGQ